MMDIVEELRAGTEAEDGLIIVDEICLNAADEIERNRAAIAELVAALKPFAHCATIFDDENRSGNLPSKGVFQSWPRLYGEFEMTVEDLRNARAAITKHNPTIKDK